MRKVLSIFLVFILIVSTLSISCFAETPVKLSINSETDTVYAGDEFTVKLMISDNSKMSGAAIDINYDKSKLEYVEGTYGGILDSSATMSIKNFNGDSGKIRFTYLSPSSSITSPGVLITVRFKALDDAVGLTKLTISVPNPGDFIAQDLSRLSYQVENASVEIKKMNVEVESSTELESQTVESTKIVETTTNPTDDINNNDDENINKIIFIVLISGFLLLLVVALLISKTKKKKSKSKKKKRKR